MDQSVTSSSSCCPVNHQVGFSHNNWGVMISNRIANPFFFCFRWTYMDYANLWCYKFTRDWLWIDILVLRSRPPQRTKNCCLVSAPPPHNKPFSLNDAKPSACHQTQAHTRPSKHLLELSMAEAEVMTTEWGGYLCLSLRITSVSGKSFIDLDRGKGRLYQHQHRETH